MTGSNSNRSIREASDAQYVTSSHLSESASVWGEPIIITREMTGQVIDSVYVQALPSREIAETEDLDLMNELRMWEEASANDIAQFETWLDEE